MKIKPVLAKTILFNLIVIGTVLGTDRESEKVQCGRIGIRCRGWQ